MSHFWDYEKPVEASKIPQPLVDKVVLLNTKKACVGIRLAGYLCGSIIKIGSTFLAGQDIFPLKEWRALSRHNAVVSIDRTSDVPLHHGAHGQNDYIFHKVISAAGFAYPSAINAFVEMEREYDESGKVEGYESYLLDDDKAKVGWEARVRRMAQKNRGRLPSGVSTLPFADIPFHLAAKNQPYSYEKYVQFVLRHCHSRRFFITDTGYMGIGPEEVEVDDQIYICAGATIPFAFREVKENHSNMDSKIFQLVGECYTEERAWKDLKSKPESPPYFTVI
ncbi:hypothetical protein TARUN_509 [Trichoderma arundinaceum]|uniref:Uncharacterized protein n=1 Tax=Trichoderma arundinaceum TaxID=490622 RepID=A0A395P065_TRIAR|nr:hypothetical protein TARUN_509 [Trichoderma arundinaceum]